MTAAWTVIAAISIALSALLAAADGALLATGHATPRQIISDPERAHRALALGRVLGHLLTGTAIALALARRDWGAWPAISTAVLLIVLNVTLVEGIARTAGYVRGMTAVKDLAPVVAIADLLLLPVTWLGGAAERAVGRVLETEPEGPAAAQRGRDEGASRFHEVVAAEASVSEAEEKLLHGVFSLGDTEVREIMVPRVDVVAIDRSTSWSEMLDRVRSSEHARFPVYDGTLDNVTGILYAKDLLPTVVADAEPDDWSTRIRPASFIPATKTIDQQLRDFKAQRTHIAVVIDEYGGTAGLVTIEDVLEEIVGEIHDEYDVEEPPIEQEGSAHFWVSGNVTLADLSELLGVELQREDITTVGGLVYDTFGRVPRAGESAEVGPFRIVVERVRRRRIERVYFERVAPPEPA